MLTGSGMDHGKIGRKLSDQDTICASLVAA